ncbi:hypothetical protein TWF281_011125 [Arthrobotrys megalospora]
MAATSGKPSSLTTRCLVVFFILALSLLVSIWYLAAHNYNTPWGIQSNRQGLSDGFSLKQRSRRQAPAEQKHVVIPTARKYHPSGELEPGFYAQFGFGKDNQPINLGVSERHETWVPDLKERERVCGNESASKLACELADVSGYYNPSVNSTELEFLISPNGFSANALVRGDWYDDIVTAGGVSINFRFGVGDYWNIPPFIGLGLSSRENSASPPNYIESLVQQEKVAEPYTSFYDIQNPYGRGGQIVIGGVDRQKINGKFDCWTDLGRPGEVRTPNVKIILGNDYDKYTKNTEFSPPRELTALISPGTPYILVPPSLRDRLSSLFPLGYAVRNGELSGYLVADCDKPIDPDNFLEFEFEKVVIRIPLEDFRGSAPARVVRNFGGSTLDNNTCLLSIGTTDGERRHSYVLGGPFFSRAYVVMKPKSSKSGVITGIALAKANETGQDIVELGGPNGRTLKDIIGDDPGASERRRKNIKVIIGAVVGGAVLLLALAAFFFFRWRKRRNLDAEPSISAPDPGFEWQPYSNKPNAPTAQVTTPQNFEIDEPPPQYSIINRS